MAPTNELLSTCQDAARAGGAELLRWRERFQVREKGPADLVTEADLASQRIIRESLLGRWPDHAFVGEEEDAGHAAGRPADDEYQWIVDPLDGTTNFVHDLPGYAVSIAVRRGRDVLAGVVFDPVADECFAATRGGGATLNGRPIRVADETDLGDALVAVSLPARPAIDSPDVRNLLAILPHCQAFRRLGAAAVNLAYIAAGRLDAYWASATKIWDIAAGALLVREAGGTITAIDGRPLNIDDPRFLAACSPQIHARLLELLEESGRR